MWGRSETQGHSLWPMKIARRGADPRSPESIRVWGGRFGVRHLNSLIRFMILCQARMFSFFVKTTPMLTARCSARTRTTRGAPATIIRNSEEWKFLPKRASYPQFLETSNSGVKVSDPDSRFPIQRLKPHFHPTLRNRCLSVKVLDIPRAPQYTRINAPVSTRSLRSDSRTTWRKKNATPHLNKIPGFPSTNESWQL